MAVRVEVVEGSFRLAGDDGASLVNRWLGHLQARGFSPRTVRAYAFDVLNFIRFIATRGVNLTEIGPMDVFDWLAWQQQPTASAGRRVVRLAEREGAAPATMNRRVSALRGLFEFAVVCGAVETNPVPTLRGSAGLRQRPRGLLGHVAGRRPRRNGQLVRQPRPLPQSVPEGQIAVFLADLATSRDRAVVLAMWLGGLRSCEVRSLQLRDVDFGMRQIRVTGKGGKQRVVPVDRAFFAELNAYLRTERPPGLSTPECFVVLRGPTTGAPMSEAGLRRIFRTHRARSGAQQVRPHRLRHTYGSDLAAAGIDLLVLRELMGHAHAETTAAYVHPTTATIAAEWAKATSGES